VRIGNAVRWARRVGSQVGTSAHADVRAVGDVGGRDPEAVDSVNVSAIAHNLRVIDQTTQPVDRPRTARRNLVVGTVVVVALVAVVAGVAWWSAPKEQVAVPTADASPETVVRAYLDAVNARDFDTANEIDARPDSDLGRFSRPVQITELSDVTTRDDTRGRVAVVFTAEFDGTDASMEDGRHSWGYVLDRGPEGGWRIVDAGVA
jgi:hypothetical protein